MPVLARAPGILQRLCFAVLIVALVRLPDPGTR
jgi:hypothetical protein